MNPEIRENFIRSELPTSMHHLIDHYSDSTHDELCREIDALRALYNEHEAEMNGTPVDYGFDAYAADYLR